MSTRANIIIKGEEGKRIYLYHHTDGYPAFVGICLKLYLKQVGQYADAYDIANDLIKGEIHYKNYKGEMVSDNDYQLTSGIHGDVEYIYEIDGEKHEVVAYATRDPFTYESHKHEVEIPIKD